MFVNLSNDSAIDLDSAVVKSPICKTILVSGVIIVFKSKANASAVSIFKLTNFLYVNDESS